MFCIPHGCHLIQLSFVVKVHKSIRSINRLCTGKTVVPSNCSLMYAIFSLHAVQIVFALLVMSIAWVLQFCFSWQQSQYIGGNFSSNFDEKNPVALRSVGIELQFLTKKIVPTFPTKKKP